MKKLSIAAVLAVITFLTACTKRTEAVDPTLPETIYADIQAVDNDGSTTESAAIIISLK